MTRLVVLTLMALAAPAAPAAAQTDGTAALMAPTGQRDAVIANGFVWHCDGASCRGQASGDRFGDQRTCKELAHQIGSVVTFTSRRGALSAEDLARCNARAKPAG